ncbi:MAG: alpha/beta hydrolase [Candidatus Heimdallarchaeota archaeon]|nr:alpha/beta hydrolase [Candidatus Heimdallarchaeota archaeon]MCK5048742.1 alpha/beta hydrolase [Candidatus Heimdallarchaeota archaeon]
MILVYVLLGIISLIILLIFYLRHKSFKINPEDGWIKIKSSNRFYKAYLIHEKPTAGRVVLFLHGWNGNDKTWKKENCDFVAKTAALSQGFDVWNLHFSARLYGDISRYARTELKSAIKTIKAKRQGQLGKEVIIVSHSTGGIVTRFFLKDSKTKHLAKHIDTVILLASPNHGLELFDKYFKSTWLSHSLFSPTKIPILGWFIRIIGSILQSIFTFIVIKLGRIILNSKSSEQLVPGSDFLKKLNSPADQLLVKGITWKNGWGTDDDLVGSSGTLKVSEVGHLDEMNPSEDDAYKKQFAEDFVSENGAFRQKAFDCDHAGFELPDNVLQALKLSSMDKPRPITGSEDVFDWIMEGIEIIATSEERLQCKHCKTIIDNPDTTICPGCGNVLAFTQ